MAYGPISPTKTILKYLTDLNLEHAKSKQQAAVQKQTSDMHDPPKIGGPFIVNEKNIGLISTLSANFVLHLFGLTLLHRICLPPRRKVLHGTN